MCHGWRSRYLLMGGVLGGWALSRRAEAGHSKGRWVTLPGRVISASACSVARRTAVWPSAVARLSQQVAQRMLDGRQPRHAHGGRQVGDARQRDRAQMPAASISLCTSPTDQQQIGQPGTRTTTFTPSCFMCRIMAGVLSSSSTCGSRM